MQTIPSIFVEKIRTELLSGVLSRMDAIECLEDLAISSHDAEALVTSWLNEED